MNISFCLYNSVAMLALAFENAYRPQALCRRSSSLHSYLGVPKSIGVGGDRVGRTRRDQGGLTNSPPRKKTHTKKTAHHVKLQTHRKKPITTNPGFTEAGGPRMTIL